MIVVWSPKAQSDLEAVEDYLTARNLPAADAVVAEILEAGASLVRHPRRGRPSAIKGRRELIITGRPYFLLYRVGRSAVTIVRVMHTSRQWPPTGSQR